MSVLEGDTLGQNYRTIDRWPMNEQLNMGEKLIIVIKLDSQGIELD